MSELRMLKQTLQPASEGLRLAVVETRLDAARVTVLLPTGVRRRVYGQAPVGAQVLVQGQQLVSQVAPARAATMIIE